MNNGVSLIEYLTNKYPTIENYFPPHLGLDLRSSYSNFLETTILIKRNEVSKVKFPRQLMDSTTYLDFIDSVVSLLVSERVANVLIKGYVDPSANSALSYKTINQHVNFQMNQMKSLNWNLLFNQIGPKLFFELILSTNGYLKSDSGNFFQLFGTESTFKKKINKEINKTSILYKRSNVYNGIRLLPKNSLVLVEEIFAIDPAKSLPKKLRSLKRILDKVVLNEDKCNYLSIYNNIIAPVKVLSNANFENTTNIFKIINFCLTAIGKIFPPSIWGSSKNKTNVFRKVVEFIKLGTKELFPINNLFLGVKLTDISWIGKSSVVTSRQDLDLRKSIYSRFIQWFFSSFICKLVKAFWYVVETATPEVGQESGGLLYFPQPVWKALTKEWFLNYRNMYLDEVQVTSLYEKESDWYNFGRLRIVPKANDFRVLCIPCKSNLTDQYENKGNEKFEYLNYINSLIRPSKEILLLKLKEFYELHPKKRTPICHSIKDVTDTILSFKKNVTSLYGNEIPTIYSLKFDMKHCYDLLDQNKIMECLGQLFEHDEESKYYFVRQYVESSNSLIKRIHNLVKDATKLGEFNMLGNSSKNIFTRNSYITDRVKTIKLSKSEIFDVVKNQVFFSKIILKENPLTVYKRKRGIFQGFPLSATLCEIVYNSLVDHEFSFVMNSPACSSLIRLADDFLVLSTSKECIEEVHKVINGKALHTYGAFVNYEKSSYLDSSGGNTSLKFVGININIKTLNVAPDILSFGTPVLKKYTSFKSVFDYLQWYYKSRIKAYYLNLHLCSIETVISYIDLILSLILTSLKRELKRILKRDKLKQSKFKEFLLYLVHETLLQFNLINGNTFNIHTLYGAIKESVIKNTTDCKHFEETSNWVFHLL